VLEPSRHCAFAVIFRFGRAFSRIPFFACLTHRLTGWSEALLRIFDLSKNRSLRSLEVTAYDISGHDQVAVLRFFRGLLATITSPAFSEVVIVFEDLFIRNTDLFRPNIFRAVRCMYEVKPFRLAFCLEIWEGDREKTADSLKRYIDVEVARGGLDITYNTRAASDRHSVV